MQLITILFTTVSMQLGLPDGLLHSLCYVESKHNINAIHYADGSTNSVGICQIKLATAKDYGFKGTEADLMKPENNIYYAGKYLKHQINKYNNITRGVVAYNRGNARLLTRSSYSDKVITHWKGLQYAKQ